jgi:tryptophan synthase alpha chain
MPSRIDTLFQELKAAGRKALIPFVTAGDPDLETTARLLPALVSAGASLIELGIPYSDPIADGPVIAASYTRALQRGIKLNAILDLVRAVRAGSPRQPPLTAPLVTMISYAIVLKHGPEAYVQHAREAGIDGLIVPDLPVEEAESLKRLTDAAALALIQLVTPTTPRTRALEIARTSSGFLYYVSVAGITGERRELPPDLAENVAWLRSHTPLPIAIGFGISAPEQVRALAPVADGLIVGSAIVRRIHDLASASRDPSQIAREIELFVHSLAQALA